MFVLGMALAASSWLLPAAVAGAEAPSRECRNTHYNVFELPFIPSVITSSGVVAGTTELHRAVVWRRKSGLQELTVPEGFHFTEPVAIMESGDVVINALDTEARKHRAFVYSHHSVIGAWRGPFGYYRRGMAAGRQEDYGRRLLAQQCAAVDWALLRWNHQGRQ
jgi:hypothetical protein